MAQWRFFSRAKRDSKPKKRKERGAALVEFALVAPLFFTVVFGGIEFGLMARTQLTIQDVARSAARVASIERTTPDADRAILESIQNRAGALNGSIERVVIFAPDTLVEDVPMGCTGELAASDDDVCTVYEDTDIAGIVDGSQSLPTVGFLASDRGQLSNVGVYIEFEYRFVTGFFDTRIMRATSVEVVELDL